VKFEIGRILHFKSEIRNFRLDSVQFRISDFGFEMQDSSNFKFLLFLPQNLNFNANCTSLDRVAS
jgi:hypothetical protein